MSGELHVWQRRDWCDEAAGALGELVGDIRAAVREIEAWRWHLYHVEGPVYGGWFLIRFLEAPGGLECDCLAFSGRNTAAGLGDLAALVRRAGATALTCCTQQAAVARLYQRQGWTVDEYFLRYEL